MSNRARARARKQKQHAITAANELSNGLHSPGGRKIKVSCDFIHCAKSNVLYLQKEVMDLRYPLKLDMGGNIAEPSRPARSLNVQFKEKVWKPAGRKKINPTADAKYHNWFTPLLFKQIESARIQAGGPK
jgi:hypothetical protein